MFIETKEGETHFCEACEREGRVLGLETGHICGKTMKHIKQKECDHKKAYKRLERTKGLTSCKCVKCKEMVHKVPKPNKLEVEGWKKEYCEKFGLCDEEMPCQCKEELKFISKLLKEKDDKINELFDELIKISLTS